jgi:hypothetical protein
MNWFWIIYGIGMGVIGIAIRDAAFAVFNFAFAGVIICLVDKTSRKP